MIQPFNNDALPDLRWSYAKEQIIVPAEDNLDLLTDQQLVLWGLFYGKPKSPNSVPKSAIDPTKMIAQLPNIWMFDIVYDGQGKVIEINTKLQGTGLDEIYGSAVDDNLVLEDFATEMSMDKEDEDVRTINLVLELVKIKKPLIGMVKQLSGKLSHLSERNLVIPVSNQGEKIDVIFGHTEVLPAILD